MATRFNDCSVQERTTFADIDIEQQKAEKNNGKNTDDKKDEPASTRPSYLL
jgi:hypothetical protein